MAATLLVELEQQGMRFAGAGNDLRFVTGALQRRRSEIELALDAVPIREDAVE